MDEPGKLRLTLHVMGTGPRSVRAIVNTRAFCDRHLRGRYELEVVDIGLRPDDARTEQLVAVPTLTVHGVGGRRRFVGDMSDAERLLRELGIALAPGSSPGDDV